MVANEEQERALPAEYGGMAAEPADLSKEDLQTECTLRGIEFDKRWGIARLQEALA